MKYNKDSVSVLVSSCNKYRYLWDIQLQLFNKYWGECPYDIYFLSESSELPKLNTKLKLYDINSNTEPNRTSDWSNILLDSLNLIKSDYIIYMQEDYVFIRDVDQNRLDKLLNYMFTNDLDYIRFSTTPPGNGDIIKIDENIFIREIKKNTMWRSSLQLSIWKKDTLTSLLNQNISISPWEFEHIDTSKFENFYSIDLGKDHETDILPFAGIYGSSNGYGIYPQLVDFLKNENIKMLNGEEINYEIRL